MKATTALPKNKKILLDSRVQLQRGGHARRASSKAFADREICTFARRWSGRTLQYDERHGFYGFPLWGNPSQSRYELRDGVESTIK